MKEQGQLVVVVVAVGVVAPELAVGYSRSEKVQRYQAWVAVQRLLDGFVPQGTGLRVSRLLVSISEILCIQRRQTLVCSTGAPKLSSFKVSPVEGSEGSRGEDGISDGVV